MHAFAARLSRASLAGRPFQVSTDEIEAGGRNAVHTIPNGGHVVEEFGPAPRRYRVTAYCGGADAAGRARALLSLDRLVGPHLLVLPTDTAMVVVDRVSRAFDRDRLGYVAVALDLTDAGDVSAPGFGRASGAGLTIAALDNLVFVAAAAVTGLVGRFAAGLVSALPGAGLAFAGAASDGAVAAAVRLELVRGLVAAGWAAGLPSASGAVFVDLADRIEALAVAGLGLVADASDWGATAATIVADLAAAADPATWPARVAALLAIVDPTPPLAVATVAGAAASAAATIASRVVAVAALATVAEAAVRRDYGDRAAAVAVRADLATRFADVLEDLSTLSPPPLDLVRAVVDLRDRVVVALRARATTLAPVVTISGTARRPALAWAWDLYRDPTRAAEIAARNRLDHPGFVPPVFEALAR